MTSFLIRKSTSFFLGFLLKNLDEAKSFYQERYASIYQKKQRYAYAICLKENNLPIGYVNINLDESHDLGYGLKKNIGIKALSAKQLKL